MVMDNIAPHPIAALSQSSIASDEQLAKSTSRKKKARQLARRVIVRALIESDGEIDDAAKKIGISPATFISQMRQYQLPRPIMYRLGFSNLRNIPSDANDESLLVGSI